MMRLFGKRSVKMLWLGILKHLGYTMDTFNIPFSFKQNFKVRCNTEMVLFTCSFCSHLIKSQSVLYKTHIFFRFPL